MLPGQKLQVCALSPRPTRKCCLDDVHTRRPENAMRWGTGRRRCGGAHMLTTDVLRSNGQAKWFSEFLHKHGADRILQDTQFSECRNLVTCSLCQEKQICCVRIRTVRVDMRAFIIQTSGTPLERWSPGTWWDSIIIKDTGAIFGSQSKECWWRRLLMFPQERKHAHRRVHSMPVGKIDVRSVRE